jgi:integrase
MPLYREGESWRVRIWFRGRARSWLVCGSKGAAAAFEARKRTELERQDPAADARVVPRFSAFCAATYAPHAKLHLKASSWRNRVYGLATLVKHLGDLRLTEITVAHVEALKAARSRAGIKPATVNDELKVLKTVLNYARELGQPVPVLKLRKLVVRGRRKAHAWTAEEVGRLFAACTEKSPDVLPLVVFLANTGCRRGEAVALEWENVDLARGVIRIFPSEEWQPKDNEPREVPINDALRPWLEGSRRSARWVFPSGRKVDGEAQPFAFWPQRKFDRARKHAGLKGGAHTLRHTYATHFLATTPDLYLLARVLGHSTTRVTELYAHLLPDSLGRARKAVAFPAAVSPAALEVAARWARRQKAAAAGRASGRKRAGVVGTPAATGAEVLELRPAGEAPATAFEGNRPGDRPREGEGSC